MDDTTRRSDTKAKLIAVNVRAHYVLRSDEIRDAVDRMTGTAEPQPEREYVDVLREKSKRWRRGVMRW